VGTVGDSLPSPADIGFDVGRSRVLIPIFSENRIDLVNETTSSANSPLIPAGRLRV
jgi:hypothetical protein